MKVFFTCASCSKETNVGGGNISLVCQSCGCTDIKFNSDVLVSPVIPGESPGKTLIKAEEPFLGFTKFGSMWNIAFPVDPKAPSSKPLITRRK